MGNGEPRGIVGNGELRVIEGGTVVLRRVKGKARFKLIGGGLSL
jgi:hypothetical protein